MTEPIKIVPVMPKDVILMNRYVRWQDRREVEELQSIKFMTGLAMSVRISAKADTVYNGKKIALIAGVSKGAIPEVGMPWMVATPELLNLKVGFLRRCKPYLLSLREIGGFKVLRNIADERNDVHIRWLKWLGAKFYGGRILYNFRRFEFKF